MPSLPPFNGVAVPSCAGIRMDGTTIRAIDTLTGINGKSLPLIQSMREHGIFSSHLFFTSEGICPFGWSSATSDTVGMTSAINLPLVWVDGTLA
jgi:hypothetical protein